MAEQVADFMDQAGWPSAHIAGISMGGYIAMAMLRLFPERVEGLGLICTKASMDSPSKRAERLQQADDMNSSALAVMARAMAVALIADDEPRSAQVQAWVSDQDPTAVAWSLRAMAARPDSLGVLRTAGSRLAVVVAGQVDPMVTAADVHQMAAALTDAGARPTVVTLAGVGHLAALEAPAAVVDALLTLSRRPPSD
jgi:pimeloyl-ACP methyl ester carboxylesterase